MSVLKVANVHFEATGANRLEYLNSQVKFRTGGGNFTVSVSGTEVLNVNTTSAIIGGSNVAGGITAAFNQANAALANATTTLNGDLTVSGNVTLVTAKTLTIGGVTANGIGNVTNQLVQVQANNKLPVLDGSNLTGLSSAGVLVSINVYTSTQTVTIPTGATQADIILCGPGGGGSGLNGGGAGGSLRKYLTGLTSGNTLALTIGSGGGAGVNGTANSTLASNTQIISTLTAARGFAGGAGGSASNGDINITGRSGGTGGQIDVSSGGCIYHYYLYASGGSPGFGLGVGGAETLTQAAGVAAVGYGGGGGAGYGGLTPGGAGTSGICIITWYK